MLWLSYSVISLGILSYLDYIYEPQGTIENNIFIRGLRGLQYLGLINTEKSELLLLWWLENRVPGTGEAPTSQDLRKAEGPDPWELRSMSG